MVDRRDGGEHGLGVLGRSLVRLEGHDDARRRGRVADGAERVSDLAYHFDAAGDHDETRAWVEAAAAALSDAVLVVENLLDPQTVILGGALPDALIDRLIARITLSPSSLAARPGRGLPRLMRGAAGRLTATRGAAALVVDRLFTPRLEAA